MVNYREILRLDSLGYSQHQIAASVHSSRNTIREVLHASKTKGLTWPLEDTLTNEEILTLLFPAKVEMATKRKEPDYTCIHRELARSGVNSHCYGQNTAAPAMQRA